MWGSCSHASFTWRKCERSRYGNHALSTLTGRRFHCRGFQCSLPVLPSRRRHTSEDGNHALFSLFPFRWCVVGATETRGGNNHTHHPPPTTHHPNSLTPTTHHRPTLATRHPPPTTGHLPPATHDGSIRCDLLRICSAIPHSPWTLSLFRCLFLSLLQNPGSQGRKQVRRWVVPLHHLHARSSCVLLRVILLLRLVALVQQAPRCQPPRDARHGAVAARCARAATREIGVAKTTLQSAGTC